MDAHMEERKQYFLIYFPYSVDWNYNHLHSILRLFDVLSNFPFATSETMRDDCLETWHIRVTSRVAERLKTEDLRKLENIRKVSKLQRMIA